MELKRVFEQYVSLSLKGKEIQNEIATVLKQREFNSYVKISSSEEIDTDSLSFKMFGTTFSILAVTTFDDDGYLKKGFIKTYIDFEHPLIAQQNKVRIHSEPFETDGNLDRAAKLNDFAYSYVLNLIKAFKIYILSLTYKECIVLR